jgi:hypothetical protein
MSRVYVTTDGFWIGYGIYWPPIHSTLTELQASCITVPKAHITPRLRSLTFSCIFFRVPHRTGSQLTKLKVKVKVILRLTVSRPICLGIKHPSAAYDQIFVTVWRLQVFWYRALSLTRGRFCHLPESVSNNKYVCQYVQLTFYMLLNVYMYVRMYVYTIYTRICQSSQSLVYNISAHTTQKTPLLCCMRIRCRGNVFTQPFYSNGHLLLLIKNLPPSNGRRSAVCFAAVA